MADKMKIKTLEEIDSTKAVKNETSVPFIKQFTSRIKSHFSQSKGEFFESSDEEHSSPKNRMHNDPMSLKHIGSDKKYNDSPRISNPNITDLNGQNFVSHMKKDNEINVASADNLESPRINVRKDSLEEELEEMEQKERENKNNNNDEDEVKSTLVIRSRKGSDSLKSVDSNFNNLIEINTEKAPKNKNLIPQFFQNKNLPKINPTPENILLTTKEINKNESGEKKISKTNCSTLAQDDLYVEDLSPKIEDEIKEEENEHGSDTIICEKEEKESENKDINTNNKIKSMENFKDDSNYHSDSEGIKEEEI